MMKLIAVLLRDFRTYTQERLTTGSDLPRVQHAADLGLCEQALNIGSAIIPAST